LYEFEISSLSVRCCVVFEGPLVCAGFDCGSSLCEKNIGDDGARDLGAALLVNMTLTTL
jgi:hypothetical protein